MKRPLADLIPCEHRAEEIVMIVIQGNGNSSDDICTVVAVAHGNRGVNR